MFNIGPAAADVNCSMYIQRWVLEPAVPEHY
jgi:hypothetical protein